MVYWVTRFLIDISSSQSNASRTCLRSNFRECAKKRCLFKVLSRLSNSTMTHVFIRLLMSKRITHVFLSNALSFSVPLFLFFAVKSLSLACVPISFIPISLSTIYELEAPTNRELCLPSYTEESCLIVYASSSTSLNQSILRPSLRPEMVPGYEKENLWRKDTFSSIAICPFFKIFLSVQVGYCCSEYFVCAGTCSLLL